MGVGQLEFEIRPLVIPASGVQINAFLCGPDERLLPLGGSPNIATCQRCSGISSTDHGEWSTCSVTCGHGSQTKTVSHVSACGDTSVHTETRSCGEINCPVNGVWGAWGEFFPCDKACGGGIQLRFRKCDNPSPSNGGLQCIGDSLQSATCNDHPCKELVTLTNPTSFVTYTN